MKILIRTCQNRLVGLSHWHETSENKKAAYTGKVVAAFSQ